MVLIVVIVVLVFLGRTGRLQPAKQRITAGIRTVRNTIRVRATSNAYNVRTNENTLDNKFAYRLDPLFKD